MCSKRVEPRGVTVSRSKPTAKVTISNRSSAFPPSARLKKKKEFLAVQDAVRASGRRLHSKHFLLLVNPSVSKQSRIGLTVTTKIDKRAVVRNRIKRYVREVFRRVRQKLLEPVDIVVIARMHSQTLSFQEVQRELLGSLQYGRLLPRE